MIIIIRNYKIIYIHNSSLKCAETRMRIQHSFATISTTIKLFIVFNGITFCMYSNRVKALTLVKLEAHKSHYSIECNVLE